MSASREKKKRQVLTQQGVAPKQLACAGGGAKSKEIKMITALVAVLAVVVIAASVFLGWIWPNQAPKSTTALKVGDHEITPAEMNFYYMDTVYQFYSQYGSYLSYLLDASKPLDQQYYDEEANITWADHFLEEAAATAATTYAMYDDAVAQGMSLSEAEQEKLDKEIESMREILSSNEKYKDMDDYLRQAYGKGSDEETYRKYLEVKTVVDAFSADYQENMSYTDEDIDAVYQEDPLKYTSVSYRSFYVSKSYFEDPDFNKDEATEEETAAANEEALKQAGAKAEQMAQACEGDEAAFAQWARDIAPEASKVVYEDDAATLCREYSYDDASSYGRDWLYAAERKAGDTAFFAAEGSGYYVYYFLNTTDNDYTTVNARQLYVSVTADQDTNEDGKMDEISDEAWSAAQTKAEELLQQWKDGEATEDSFADLARVNSADANTKTNGGLVENIGHFDLSDERGAWCYDTSRKAGDCELVKTATGYYIMYFVGAGENRRADLIRTDLENEAYAEWFEGYQEKYEREYGSGAKYVNTGVMLSGV